MSIVVGVMAFIGCGIVYVLGFKAGELLGRREATKAGADVLTELMKRLDPATRVMVTDAMAALRAEMETKLKTKGQ